MNYDRIELTRLEGAMHYGIGVIHRLFEAYGHYQRTGTTEAEKNLRDAEVALNDVMVRIAENYSKIKTK